jgi:uncharacterized surface protein with fasciclin (FAS1) repeats
LESRLLHPAREEIWEKVHPETRRARTEWAMSKKSQQMMRSVACLAAAAATCLPAAAESRSVAEFGEEERRELGWRVVDDGVMGGLSKGRLSFTDADTLRFRGELSLENNGGFSSVRTGSLDLDLSEFSGLEMRVRGDGRSYEVRLGSDARYRGMEVSFKAGFPTRKGEWQEVRVPFTDFIGSFRGRILEDEVLNPAEIRRVGLLLADKKAGSFDLEVDWIRAYRAGADSTIVGRAVGDGRFKTLVAALQKAKLAGLLQGDGPYTVFAPTDDAFSKLPEGTVERLLKPENLAELQAVLKYHVSPGATDLAGALAAGSVPTAQGGSLGVAFDAGKVKVNASRLVDADISCSNGVIHVIDSVLLPPAPEAANDILGAAAKAGNFGTLIAAVEAAGLTGVLRGEGPFTVLAPTNDAFAALPDGALEGLLKKKNVDQLKAVLTYHVLAGAVSAGDALNAKSAKALNGQSLEFSVEDGRLKVNGVNIIRTDISCDNGTIHVIDAVLLPAQGEEEAPAGADGDPRSLIEEAIDRGVPVFNHGDHAKCAAIYKRCLQQLASSGHLDGTMRKSLQAILERAEGVECDTDRAWIYRHALDGVHHAVMAGR